MTDRPDCPNCGASGIVSYVDVDASGEAVQRIPTTIECSERCYETDPDGYRAAVRAVAETPSYPEARTGGRGSGAVGCGDGGDGGLPR